MFYSIPPSLSRMDYRTIYTYVSLSSLSLHTFVHLKIDLGIFFIFMTFGSKSSLHILNYSFWDFCLNLNLPSAS